MTDGQNPLSGRKLLGMFRPAKPVGEMSEKELDEFADAMYQQMMAQMGLPLPGKEQPEPNPDDVTS